MNHSVHCRLEPTEIPDWFPVLHPVCGCIFGEWVGLESRTAKRLFLSGDRLKNNESRCFSDQPCWLIILTCTQLAILFLATKVRSPQLFICMNLIIRIQHLVNAKVFKNSIDRSVNNICTKFILRHKVLKTELRVDSDWWLAKQLFHFTSSIWFYTFIPLLSITLQKTTFWNGKMMKHGENVMLSIVNMQEKQDYD